MSGNFKNAQSEFDEIKAKQGELASLYRKHFPKVDPRLVDELVSHGENSRNGHDRLYALQVIAKDGTDSNKAREYFLSKTGRAPAAYEGGRHYVLNLYLTLDMVKEFQSSEAIEHITGEYTFGSYSVSQTQMHRGTDEQSGITET
jgi:hypothetical protein